MIVSWAIENNLVYLRSILVHDCDPGLLGNNLVYFEEYSDWACDCDRFLGY